MSQSAAREHSSARRFLVVLLLLGLWAPLVGAEFRFSDLDDVEAIYVDHDLVTQVGLAAMTPTALAAADLDEDGVADLVCGYAWPDGQVLTVHRGNIDALYPYSAGAKARKLRGEFVDAPFLPQARMLVSPVRPDFLATGDFDNDGHLDVVVAAAEDSSLHLLPGNGAGAFGAPRSIELPGEVTALASGEVHRADGMADLVVGVRTPHDFSVLVFQGPHGAIEEEPETLTVHEIPTSFAIGRFAGGPWRDLVIAAGMELVLVHGRDRQLVLNPSMRRTTGSSPVDGVTMPSRIESVAWGDVVGDARHRGELAVLLEDGTIRALRFQDGDWVTIGEHHVPRPHSRAFLMRARLSRAATHDLVVVDTTGQRLHLVTATSAEDESLDSAALETIATRHLDRPALHAVSMRLNRDAVADLVLLQPDSEGPSVMTSGVDSVITVNTDLDSAAAGDGACSLREALENSNTDSDTTAGDCAAGAGADTIEFAIAGGGSTATMVLGSALPSITDAVTLDGTTQGCATPPCIALDGSVAGTGVDGLTVVAGSSTVRGLAVHGFGRHGIYVTSSGNVIEGNFVGTDLTGTVDLGNTNVGVFCEGANATGNVIGGTTPQARNVVSGNDVRGIAILSNANDTQVLGNYIGTDVTGALDLGNRRGLRVFDSVNATVGGTASGAGNVVSGNDGIGILLETVSGSTVQGNFVGTDVTGAVDLGNTGRGVNLANGASNNTIGGTAPGARNVVSGNDANGVHLKPDTTGNLVAGNFIGTDITGTVAIGNTDAGVEIETGSNNTIGGAVPGSRNLISASGQMGVLLENTSGNSVLGNYIGTDVSGSIDLGNNGAGVRLSNADNNTIGGTADAERNVISGNGGDGIFIAPSGVANRVLGNFIGIDASGSAPLGNTLAGVEIEGGGASGNVIGGPEAGAGNVISGNGQMGVLLDLTSGNSLLGNYIGTDAGGMADLGNGTVGVQLSDASSNTIGGGLPGEGNLISGNEGNGIGISGVSAVSNVVAGNCIGTDVTCRVPLGNGLRGVRIHTIASNNTIGGTAAGDGNVIAFNTEEGVVVDTAAVGNSILGNSVFANGQLGIDLQEDGVTANDTDDPDVGANDLQNYPVLAAANATPIPDINIDGTLNSTNNETFRIEFFAGSACGPSGHGEGERYLGSSDQVTGGGGDVSFSVTLAAAVSDGEAITATATNPADSTSEFSACITAACSILVVFGDTLTAQDKDTLVWATAQDVRFSKGDLAAVSGYVTTDDGVLTGANSLGISGDHPATGEGLYYLVKPLGCGSWQHALGAEPGRDGGLP